MSNPSSAYIETLRSFLCFDGVIGSTERWWSGKKGFDFLDSGQAADGQQRGEDVAKCVEERVNRLLVELSPPDSYDQKATSDIEAVERGLAFMMQLAVDDNNFKSFGSDIFQTFYDIATSAEEPLRRFALLRTEVAAQMWLQNYPSLSRTVDDDKNEISPDELLDFIMGMYTLERVGIGHDAKEEVREAVFKYSVEDFFGVSEDTFRGDFMEDDGALPMTLREFSNALAYSFYASKIGVDIKVDFSSVLALLPRYRPYMRFPQLQLNDVDEFDSYAAQLSLLCTLVHVLSNFGELRLSEGLLPLEFAYLSDPVHVTRAVACADVHLLGELCHCLSVFGLDRDNHEPLRTGLAYLRESQLLTNGSWPTRDARVDPYSSYHATMCAVIALNPQKFRGFGPSDPKLLDQLSGAKFASRLHKKEGISKEELPNFIDTPLHNMSSFSELDRLYSLSANAVYQEFAMSAQIYGLSRLRNILGAQKLQDKEYQGPLMLSQRHKKQKLTRDTTKC